MMHHTSQKGFTLIETMVAIAVIGVTLVAPFYAVEQSLMASYTARDQLTASMLAQEGIEYVREVRDNNYLTNYKTPGSVTWLHGLDVGATSCFANFLPDNSNKCTVDTTQINQSGPVTQRCAPAGCRPLNLNTNPSSYLYDFYNQQADQANVVTPFVRSIQLCYTSPTMACDYTLTSSNEVQVTSTVSWVTQNVPHTTQVVEYLENTD